MTASPFEGLPKKHFKCVLADPPWRFNVWSEKGKSRSPDRHYPTMTIAQMLDYPLVEHIADDSWLWLWVTGPILAEGGHVKLMRRWGFRPSSVGLAWVKLQNREEEALFINNIDSFHMGMGHTTRHNVELCVLGRRGKPGRLSKAVRELIVAPVREHSRKPWETHERIEQFCEGPYLELFARERPHSILTEQWTVWGNQLDRFSRERYGSGAV